MSGEQDQTPITKFMADFGRRQTLIASRLRGHLSGRKDTPTAKPPTSSATRIQGGRLNFDDTFLQNQSFLNISPATPGMSLFSSVSPSKKRRLTLFKSDADENMETLRKKADEYQRLLQESQTALIDSRARASKLETQSSKALRDYKLKMDEFEETQKETNAKCRELTLKAENLEDQLNKSQENEKKAQDKLHSQQEEHLNKIATMEKRIRDILIENYDLKTKCDEIKLEFDEKMRKLTNELSDTERGADKWVIDCQLLKDQITLLQSQLKTTQTDLKEAQVLVIKYQEYKDKLDTPYQEEIENEKIKGLENQYLKAKYDNHKLVEINKKLMEENDGLRSRGRDELVLEEKINYFERQNRKLKDELNDKLKTEEEKKLLEQNLYMWIEAAKKFDSSCTSSMEFERYLRQVQNLLFELKHENSDYKIKVESLTKDLSKSKEDSNKYTSQIKGLTDEKDKLTKTVKSLSRKLFLMTKNRDSLQGVIGSYEQEFTSLLTPPLQERNRQLEEIVLGYEKLVNDEEIGIKPCENCTKLNSTIEEMKKNNEDIIRLEEELNQTLASTSASLDATTSDETKIVSFGLNPSRLSIEARIKELIAENERLKGKIEELENNTQVFAGGSTGITGDIKSNEEYKSLQRRYELLSEAYDYETQQLTIACYKLMGFHVTLVREPQNQIRLQSVYSNCAQDNFIFQENPENGDMALLESPILDQFRQDIEQYLINEGSIPSFLASVCLAYASNQVQPSIYGDAESGSSLQIQSSQSQQQSTSNLSQQHSGSREIQVTVRRGSDDSSEEDDYDLPGEGEVRGEPAYDSEEDGEGDVDEEGMGDEEIDEEEDEGMEGDEEEDIPEDANESDDSDVVELSD